MVGAVLSVRTNGRGQVGRGGEQYQDLISGVDADASNSVHEYRGYDGQLGVTNPNPFALKVLPHSESPSDCLGLEFCHGQRSEAAASGHGLLTHGWFQVEPGRTDATASLAQGDFFSLSTCGTISSFTVLARDSFLNRRPGGDSIGYAARQIPM